MKLRVSKFYGRLHALIQRFHARLPRAAWRLYHAPIGRSFREESMLERIAPLCSLKTYPPSYSIDSKLAHLTAGVPLLSPDDGFRSEVVKVRGALVLGDGTVVCGGIVHRGSLLYGRISPERLLRASRAAFNGKPRPTLARATLISTQMVDQGSYGDFVLEFSLPLAANYQRIDGPMLVACGYVSKFCGPDLEPLHIAKFEIPETGVSVDELTIVGPCQIYDNFTRHNVLAMRSAFPVTPAKPSRNVYISRAGYSETSEKRPRVIKNEVEIEGLLASRGFNVLRAHEVPNCRMREAVAGAEIVVGSHGSGLFHLLWGNPRAIVELASESWWGASCYKFSQVLQTPAYRVIAADQGAISLEKLDAALAALGCQAE